MEADRMSIRIRLQQGVALPVMLIMLTVMLVSSIYLLKSTNSTTLTTANLAYDASLSKAVDLGLLTGFQWLSDTAASANKGLLNNHNAAHGYLATLDTSLSVSDSAFWTGSQTIDDSSGPVTLRIEYVVHRMCALEGAYDMIGQPSNTCVQTAANTATLNNSTAVGDSLATDSPSFAGTPQVHYVITARVFGTRGGNVVNQSIVMIGA
jgi:hypothetical protein